MRITLHAHRLRWHFLVPQLASPRRAAGRTERQGRRADAPPVFPKGVLARAAEHDLGRFSPSHARSARAPCARGRRRPSRRATRSRSAPQRDDYCRQDTEQRRSRACWRRPQGAATARDGVASFARRLGGQGADEATVFCDARSDAGDALGVAQVVARAVLATAGDGRAQRPIGRPVEAVVTAPASSTSSKGVSCGAASSSTATDGSVSSSTAGLRKAPIW